MNDTDTSIPIVLSGQRSISLSLYVAGGIIIATIIFTCCCTLLVRNKCARLLDKLKGGKKKQTAEEDPRERVVEEEKKEKGTRERLIVSCSGCCTKRTGGDGKYIADHLLQMLQKEGKKKEIQKTWTMTMERPPINEGIRQSVYPLLRRRMRTWKIGVCVVLGMAIFYPEIHGTIDVNLSELEYLAARLDPFECRRLIAALHYTTYDLPNNLAAAERKVDEEIPCLRQLLHWNSSPAEGRGKTHAAIVHRLRQLNRDDLADWLGKTAFGQLGKDLDDAIALPFEEVAEEDAETSAFHATDEPAWTQEEDPWLPIDTILVALVLGLLGILLTLIVALIARMIKKNRI